jgi:tripartite-type tricarboxylate transporter receptor subunit TctC
LKRRGVIVGAAGAVLAPAVVRAQEFPTKPVRVVVPYPAGGGTDLVARLIVPRLADRWKQTVVIDNKGGASGILAARSCQVGARWLHALIMTSAHTINPFTTKTRLDTERLRRSRAGGGLIALVGSPKAGFDTAEKFMTAARAAPGKYTFGSTENTTRMVGELFRLKSGLKIENVAYKGAAPMMQELAGGHIPVGFTSPLTVMSHHRAGTLRMLAVSSGKRLAVLPEIPTMAEIGAPGVDQSAWFSLFGPGGLPPALAQRLRDDVVAVLAEPGASSQICGDGRSRPQSSPERRSRDLAAIAKAASPPSRGRRGRRRSSSSTTLPGCGR